MPTFTEPPSIDMTAPTVLSFSPAGEANAVVVGTNIVVTFSEPIAKGAGTIVLKTTAGVTVATYDAATSANLNISGNTLTINPSVDLAYGTGYKVEFAAGTIKDMAGNSYAGTSSYNFTTVGGILPFVTLSPGFASVVEGNAGTKLMTLTVTLSAAASTAVSVDYVSSDGTAVAGSDYTATSGTLNFAVGETTKTITVPILGDTAFESDELFFISLTSATGAVLGTNGTAIAMATITNDDSATLPIATVSPAFLSVTEGNSGAKLMTLTVTLSAAAATAVSVDYASSDGTAVAGSDYTATSGAITFAVGETVKTFAVPILGDTAFEGDESFFINLTGATGAVLGTNGTASAIATIANDDSSGAPADGTAPTVSTFTPSDEAKGVQVGANITFTFNEPIQWGTGSITLKDATGTTVAAYNAGPSSNLSLSGNTLTLNPTKDFGIFTGYKVEIGAGAVKDSAGNSNLAVSDYNFTTQTVDGLYHFFVVAFNAAPGVEYMNQLAEAWNYGYDLRKIVNVFTTKYQFTDVYPLSMSHLDMATSLVANIVKNSASDQAKREAIADIKGALDIGWTVGDMIYTVFGNLATKPLDDPTWGGTAQQFLNETAVARYYTEVMGAGGTDLATLRAVIGSVDNHTDVSTPELIATLIGVELAAMH